MLAQSIWSLMETEVFCSSKCSLENPPSFESVAKRLAGSEFAIREPDQ